MIFRNKLYNILIAIIGLFFAGCSVSYNLSGTALPENAETISINQFYNESGMGPPDLPQTFTEKTREFFQQNSGLDLVKSNGDLKLEGRIVTYQLNPIAPTSTGSNESASLMRLTIAVQVQYVNTLNEEDNYNRRFSFFADFPSSSTLRDVEEELIETISDQLILDIYTASFDNW